MRSKKKILLVSENDIRNSILKFALGTHSFAVSSALSASDAAYLLGYNSYDLLLCDLPLTGAQSLFDLAAEVDARLPILVLAKSGAEVSNISKISALIIKPDYCFAYLLERIKVLVARQRGRIAKRISPVAAPAMSAADRRIA